MDSPQRWVLHADMDAFYASIEQRDRPELRGLPVIVGAHSARGVVAAASYEARRFGVHSAMPGFRARQLCPEGVFLPADMQRYAKASHAVHEVFVEFTPLIEPLALDEAFLDITGSVGLFGGPEPLARRLKARVLEHTGLVVSVGVAPNKLVAKIACSQSKPDGLRLVTPAEVAGFLAPLPVRKLWGVGPVFAAELERQGFRTMGDLARLSGEELTLRLGDRGAPLGLLARGIDHRQVDADREPKSIGEENTFEQDVSDDETVVSAITSHADAVAERARRLRLRGFTVVLKVKLATAEGVRPGRTRLSPSEPVYPLLTRRTTLAFGTDDGRVIRNAAVELWLRENLGQPIRLVGVSLTNLRSRAGEQLDLFEQPARENPLGRAIDAIRARFGEAAIRPAVGTPGKLTPSMRAKPGRDR